MFGHRIEAEHGRMREVAEDQQGPPQADDSNHPGDGFEAVIQKIESSAGRVRVQENQGNPRQRDFIGRIDITGAGR